MRTGVEFFFVSFLLGDMQSHYKGLSLCTYRVEKRKEGKFRNPCRERNDV